MPKLLPPHFFEQKQFDEALTLRTLNVFAVDLIAIPNVEDLFWYVAQNVVGKLNFSDCVIYQADDEQRVLTQVAALGEKNPFGRSIVNPLRIPFGEGITGRVAQNREAIIVDDLLRDQSYIPDTQPARSEICVPLVMHNRLVGVIDSEHPEPGAFGKAELEILTTVAAMTSAKLELLEEAERSRQRYRDLVQSHAQLNLETTNRKALETDLFNARKLEAVGRLTGRFAHDFNNLLTGISGNLELLEGDCVSPESKESLDYAKAAAARGAQLIRDMLAFSQRTRLSPTQIDLNTLVSTACALDSGIVTSKVEMNLDEKLWLVNADATMARNALVNLITNAQDAMPHGGSLKISTENIRQTWSDDAALASKIAPGRYVRLSVEDDGVGISEESHQQIFDPFYTTKPVGAGTGLGLSMILGFMQQSGGTVSVETKINSGSTFRLYFPAATDDANDLLTMER
ncbi:ATP-binding protein [Puniceibacterium sediminis]|uniref:histidine kinase n=1 Tax=Puniceibacterium sediminis TaxID=1608407 RepID=A0A238Y6T9_9RHOB|nr:ATP-binding protein [Puniceibacterium sediminis]SNR66730.1 Signal transduction histidine kinase [Puniceibacterium sediminis]